jgi:ABC-type uncharacterized transport system ATPase component
LIGSQGSGKSELLAQLSAKRNIPVTNLNLELSKRLKNIPKNDRCFYMHDFIEEIIREVKAEYIFFDNIEILFSRHLKIDPLGQLKNISKYNPLVVVWNGKIENKFLVYAERSHPDYVAYKLDELECEYYEIKE